MLSDNEIQIERLPPLRKMKNGNSMDDQKTPPQKSGWGKRLVIVILCGLVVLGAMWVVKKRQAAADQQNAAAHKALPPVPVVAGPVEQKDMPIYLDGLGTAQAFNTVTLRVRVDGQLQKVAFVEGQEVHVGDLLAQIDPAPFQAALNQAIARKSQDEAQLLNAQSGLKRETTLLAAKIDSQEVYDTQKALTDQLGATVRADQAAIDSARVQLNYTTITSPIEGRTGIRQVDQGNIVRAADTNGLVVITQLKPISVMFTLPEQNLVEIHQQAATNGAPFKVLAVGRDNTNVFDEGTLTVIDNQIDINTGTIRLKGTFPNEHEMLWPGQFVNVRLLLMMRQGALVVPASAIQRGPDGAYVFVIENNNGGSRTNGASGKRTHASTATKPKSQSASDHKPKTGNSDEAANQELLTVKLRPVTVAPQIEAGQALIESGLQKGEIVVVDGQYKLQDGSPVRITPPAKTANATSSPKDSAQ